MNKHLHDLANVYNSGRKNIGQSLVVSSDDQLCVHNFKILKSQFGSLYIFCSPAEY